MQVGKRFGFLDRESDIAGLAKELESWKSEAIPHSGYWTRCPYTGKPNESIPPLPPLFDTFLCFVNPQSGRRTRPACSGTVITQRQNTEDFSSASLSNLQDISAQSTPHACLASLCANTDASAIYITLAVYHIYKDPVTLKRMRSHIDIGVAAGLVSRRVTAEESRAMSYLQAVLKEALRMQTSSGLPHSWLITNSGVTFDDHVLPRGVRSLDCGKTDAVLTVGRSEHSQHQSVSSVGRQESLW